MLGLTFRSDISAVDAAIEMLVEELNKLATSGSGDRDLVRTTRGKKPYRSRQAKPEGYSRGESAERKRDEQTQATANRLVAYIAAAGRVAGFDVEGSNEG